ncbi:MAG: hypothetical protein II020_02695, partial [Lachnospiraceae bacterium]|nr:hypothetical protein [Lachnospiraceae bacterium]
MKRIWKILIVLAALVLTAGIIVTACGSKKKENSGYTVYFLNKNATALYPVNVNLRTADVDGQIGELLSLLTSKKQEV